MGQSLMGYTLRCVLQWTRWSPPGHSPPTTVAPLPPRFLPVAPSAVPTVAAHRASAHTFPPPRSAPPPPPRPPPQLPLHAPPPRIVARSVSILHLVPGRRLRPSSTHLITHLSPNPALLLFPSTTVSPTARASPTLLLDGTWKQAKEMHAASLRFLSSFAVPMSLPVDSGVDGDSMVESEVRGEEGAAQGVHEHYVGRREGAAAAGAEGEGSRDQGDDGGGAQGDGRLPY